MISRFLVTDEIDAEEAAPAARTRAPGTARSEALEPDRLP
jgi:hypothetical protein